MRKPEDTKLPELKMSENRRSQDSSLGWYNQAYVDFLKAEIEHYKKLYRDLLVATRYQIDV